MAWRNIWRNPRRSILTIMAIVFATLLLVFMLSWQFGSYHTMIDTSVKMYTGHLQVQEKGYGEKKDIRLAVPDPEGVARILDGVTGVDAYSTRASAFSLVSSRERTSGVLVVGIDPVREGSVSTITKLIRKGSFLSSGDTNRAVVGALLSKNMQVVPGDELVLLGQGRDGSIAATVVSVRGIFESGQDEFDRGTILIPLPFFQDVFSMNGAVHEVVVLGRSQDDVATMKETIAARIARLEGGEQLVVLDWMELLPGIVQAIKMDLVSGFIFYVILIVVVGFSILNTFLMAIFERKKEFGVLSALGAGPKRLMKLLLIESASMTLVGIVLGIAGGCLVTWYFQVHGILLPGASDWLRMYGLPERMFPRLSLLSISIGAGIVLIITLLTALYPAFAVRRIEPARALKAA
ncbi:MAG: FtsX-like permease family protein [Deltaproteobacteria bacterium]|nr:FtsX-like permease family protein [Deltaproteobacteria bacterium]NIS77681.1 FtsX-like permease family protein [Deltaproteobacteria bacterium]